MPFKKGQSGNPKGRPKNSKVGELRKALARAKKRHSVSLLNHCVNRAYESDSMAIAIINKIIPNKKYVEADEERSFTINVINSYRDKQDKDTE